MQKNLDGAYILSLATAVPKNNVSQEFYADFVTTHFDLIDKEKKVVRGMCLRSGIQKRHTVINDYLHEKDKWGFLGRDFPKISPGTHKRNNVYKQEAPRLAKEVATKALNNWSGNKSDLTHVIFISCTGLMAPGVEFLLIKELGLNDDTQRLGINYMGCFGAFRGLAIAKSIALENPKNRVLVVCVELCTLHMQSDNKVATIISNLLFADGASAAIVGVPNETEKPLWKIEKSACHAFDDSLGDMSWEVGDNGFIMNLSAEVPKLVKGKIKEFAIKLAGDDDLSNFSWAIHPGGRAVISGIEDACSLTYEDTVSSWEILKNYGNMSSGTILFVLEYMAKNSQVKDALAFGFGPGLSMEGLLLKA